MKPTEKDIDDLQKYCTQRVGSALPDYFTRFGRPATDKLSSIAGYYYGDQGLNALSDQPMTVVLPLEVVCFAFKENISIKQISNHFDKYGIKVVYEWELPKNAEHPTVQFLPLPAELLSKLGIPNGNPTREEIQEACLNAEVRYYYPLLIAPYMFALGDQVGGFVAPDGKGIYWLQR